jgi:predicted aspartyl protease
MLLVTAVACDYPAPSRVDAPSDATEGTIPFDLAGPGGAALMVPVHINGQGPYDFVFDTGATFTCVDAGLAQELALPEHAAQIGFARGLGGTGQTRLVAIDSLRIGAAQAFDLTACTLDLEHLQMGGLQPMGLVGLNYMRAFHVTLDFQQNHLHLRAP